LCVKNTVFLFGVGSANRNPPKHASLKKPMLHNITLSLTR
jgi:hypothetical protein